jgi:hypothetical protein
VSIDPGLSTGVAKQYANDEWRFDTVDARVLKSYMLRTKRRCNADTIVVIEHMSHDSLIQQNLLDVIATLRTAFPHAIWIPSGVHRPWSRAHVHLIDELAKRKRPHTAHERDAYLIARWELQRRQSRSKRT